MMDLVYLAHQMPRANDFERAIAYLDGTND
jgi:hypothetical protein